MTQHFLSVRAWPGWSSTFDLAPIAALDDDQVIPALDDLANRWNEEHPGMVQEMHELRRRDLELRARGQGVRLPPSEYAAVGDGRIPARPLLDDVAVLAGWVSPGPGLCMVAPGRSLFYPSGFELFYGCEERARAEGLLELLRANCSWSDAAGLLSGGGARLQFRLSPTKLRRVERAQLARSLAEFESDSGRRGGWLDSLAEEASRLELLLDGSAVRLPDPSSSEPQPTPPVVTHADDFSWLTVNGTTFEFHRPQQSEVIRILYRAWVDAGRVDGCGLRAATIGEGIDSAAARFNVRRVFAGHAALESILRSHGKSGWALHLGITSAEGSSRGKGAEKERS